MYLFIMSHVGSGAECLCATLSSHPLAHRCRAKDYVHGSDLIKMKEEDQYAKVFFDRIDENAAWNNSLSRFTKLIYFIREPLASLRQMPWSKRGAARYYCFRLRRLYEMARANPGLLINYDEWPMKCDEIWPYIGIKPVEPAIRPSDQEESDLPYVMRQHLQSRYEHYLSLLKSCCVQDSYLMDS